MPLFGQKRHSNDRKKQENSTPLPSHPPPPPGPGTQMTPTLPPPPLPPPFSEVNNATATGGQRQTMIPARRELLFHSQLAHGSSTKQIQDFSNVKELYQKIAEAFSLEQDEVGSLFTVFFLSPRALMKLRWGNGIIYLFMLW